MARLGWLAAGVLGRLGGRAEAAERGRPLALSGRDFLDCDDTVGLAACRAGRMEAKGRGSVSCKDCRCWGALGCWPARCTFCASSAETSPCSCHSNRRMLQKESNWCQAQLFRARHKQQRIGPWLTPLHACPTCAGRGLHCKWRAVRIGLTQRGAHAIQASGATAGMGLCPTVFSVIARPCCGTP